MPQFPPLPSWDSLHPLIIHFPIALLLLCPLFIVISAVLSPPKGRPYMVAALIVLLLGTGSLFIAASTGEEAAELAERGGAMNAVLETHEHLASEARIAFSILSVILVGIFFLPRFLGPQRARLSSTILPVAFLVSYSAGIGLLVNTAHAGGRLVHEFGVHAMMPAATEQSIGANVTVKTTASADKE